MSRDINDLVPKMQIRVSEFIHIFNTLSENRKEDIELLIYCTHRTFEQQAKLYRRGRAYHVITGKADELAFKYSRPDLKNILLSVGPQYGKKVTYAAPGQSMHNYGYAFDAVALKAGKPLWNKNEEAWQLFGKVAKRVGIEWAGDWNRFKEYPHIQMPNLHWTQLI